MTDFTAHEHPVLAVACPTCGAKASTWCHGPSGQTAGDLHEARRIQADWLFMEQHGDMAAIIHAASGWLIDPCGRARDWGVQPNRREAVETHQLDPARLDRPSVDAGTQPASRPEARVDACPLAAERQAASVLLMVDRICHLRVGALNHASSRQQSS